jgi:hypothetical protein
MIEEEVLELGDFYSKLDFSNGNELAVKARALHDRMRGIPGFSHPPGYRRKEYSQEMIGNFEAQYERLVLKE